MRLDILPNSITFKQMHTTFRASHFLFSIFSISIYDSTQSDIRGKSDCGMHLLRVSVFNFECLDILLDLIGHPSKKILSFEFSSSFHFQFGASRYITWLNQTFESKVIVIWICSEHQHSISSVSIYYGTQSNIRVKSYCRLNLLRASVFNYERLDILRDSIGHPSKKLLSLDFSQSFSFQFLASWYTTGHNPQSNIRVKSYCRLIFLRPSVFNFESLGILRDTIGHPSQKLLSFEFAQSFCFQLRASRYITGLNWTFE